MTTINTMNPTAGQFVKYEAPQNYSREDVTVNAGQNLTAGTVVGRITATGRITAFNPGASDGSQNAIGVLVNAVNATAANTPGVIIARHAIVVDSPNLVWAVTATDPQRATAIAALRALGILARRTA